MSRALAEVVSQGTLDLYVARSRTRVTHVLVAVPAHDEAATVASCVAAIDAAASAIRPPTVVVVAADRCSDDTAHLAAACPVRHVTVAVVEGSWGGAGATRRAAAEAGLAIIGRTEGVWIANTDADSVPTPTWLADQLSMADFVDAVAGIVDLDPREVTDELLGRFRAVYRTDGEHHLHVHGANLGVRATAYVAAGGWCPRTMVGEDHGLWSRLIASGADVVHTTNVRVVTSGRMHSRVEGGFASDLRALLAVEPAA